jgi:hypothetical protein
MAREARRSRTMVDVMPRPCNRFIRVLALVLAGTLVAAGCGSAAGDSTQTSPAATRAASTHGRSGIVGEAVAVVCGGASSGGQGCRRQRVPATVAAVRMPSGRRIANAQTDGSGRFRLDVPPGTYQVQAHTTSVLIWARVVTARVGRHQVVHVTVTFVPRHPLPVAPGSASG